MARVKRSIGALMFDMEKLLDEMVDVHELETGNILHLIYGHLQVHRPDAFEEYVDGGSPILYYGAKEQK